MKVIHLNHQTCDTSTNPEVVRNEIKKPLFDRPEIQKYRNFLLPIKEAITTVSHKAAISVKKARLAVQATCKKLYNHRYYLTSQEQDKYEPKLQCIDEEDEETDENEVHAPKSKKPRSAEKYLREYKYVLPDRKTISDYKHKKALQQEITCATALATKSARTRATLHYDSTTCSRIDREWPSLILSFQNDDPEECKMFPLRALLFCIRG